MLTYIFLSALSIDKKMYINDKKMYVNKVTEIRMDQDTNIKKLDENKIKNMNNHS